jgi:membrane fusion protein, multidrug efflux system
MKRNREKFFGQKTAAFLPGICFLFLSLLFLLSLPGCGKEEKKGAAAPPAPAVEVAEVTQKDVPIFSEWVGTLDGVVNATIRAQVQGYLTKQNYKEGDFVKKGQALFEIDARPFQASLEQAVAAREQAQASRAQSEAAREQAKASVAQAKAAVEQAQAEVARTEARYAVAKLNLDRVRPLTEQNALSQKDLDDAVGGEQSSQASVVATKASVTAAQAKVTEAQAAVAAAEAAVGASKAAVVAAQANVDKAQLELSFTKILSPIDGIAGIAKAQLGNLVGPGSIGELTTVSTVDPIKCYVALSEQEYMRIVEEKNKAAGKGKVPLQLILANGTTYPHKGEVAFADRQVDVTTGTLQVAALFPNPQNVLRPGQFGRVRAEMGIKKSAMAVPQRAVSEVQGRYVVAVVGPENKVAIKQVKVGERVGQLWIIDEGLKPGDKVVAEGVQKVRDGMAVTPKPFGAAEQEAPKGEQKPGKEPEAKPQPKPGKR